MLDEKSVIKRFRRYAKEKQDIELATEEIIYLLVDEINELNRKLANLKIVGGEL